MKLKETIAYVLGSAAAGGAIYYGVSSLAKSKGKNGSGSRGKTLVRVTENGRKYHRDNCPLLHGETRVINVADALENYEPCKACHPPGGVDSAADETMDPKRAYSRIVADANGTTARTTESARMEAQMNAGDVDSTTGDDDIETNVRVSKSASGTRGSSTTAAARAIDGSSDAATTTTNGVQNDPVGEG